MNGIKLPLSPILGICFALLACASSARSQETPGRSDKLGAPSVWVRESRTLDAIVLTAFLDGGTYGSYQVQFFKGGQPVGSSITLSAPGPASVSLPPEPFWDATPRDVSVTVSSRTPLPTWQQTVAFASGPQIAKISPTLSSLRSSPTPKTGQAAYVEAYSTPGDSGGGVFVFDSSSRAQTDGGTVVSLSGRRNAGRWLRQYQGAIRPEWFGAKGDGVTDDRPALQKALDAAMRLQSPQLAFSPKTYCLTTLTAPNSALVGQDAMIAYAAPDSALRSLELLGNGATLFGNVDDGTNHDRFGAILGLKFNPENLKIKDLSFVRAARVIKDLSNTGFQGLWFTSANSGTNCGSIEISRCTFNNCHRAYDIGAGGAGTLGLLHVKDSKFLFPYAANTVATFADSGANQGGAQGERASDWVQQYTIERIFFDGGEDPYRSPNQRRKDGFVMSSARNITIKDSTFQNFDVEGIYYDPNPRMDWATGPINCPGPGKTAVLPTNSPNRYSPGMRIGIGNQAWGGGTFFTVTSVKNGKVTLREDEDPRNEKSGLANYPFEEKGFHAPIFAVGTMGNMSFVAENNTFIGRTNDTIKEPHGLGTVGIAMVETKATIRNNQTDAGIAYAIVLKSFFPYEIRNAGSVVSGNKITLPPISKLGTRNVGGQLGISLAGPSIDADIHDNTIDLNTGDGAKGIDLNGENIRVTSNIIYSSGIPNTFRVTAYGIALGDGWGGMFNVQIHNNFVEGATYGVGGGVGRDGGKTISVQDLETRNVIRPVQYKEWLHP